MNNTSINTGMEWKENVIKGSTEIWTRIAGFRVQSANHYTMEPTTLQCFSKTIYIINVPSLLLTALPLSGDKAKRTELLDKTNTTIKHLKYESKCAFIINTHRNLNDNMKKVWISLIILKYWLHDKIRQDILG